MNTYVEVRRDAFAATMAAAGFAVSDELTSRFGEVAYQRRHSLDRRLVVTVYSSIPANSERARSCGADAVRVHAHFEWLAGEDVRRKNLHRAKVLRVNSVQGVLDRTVQAARDAYAACNRYRKEKLL